MGIWRKEIGEEAKQQLWLAGPMVFVCVLQHSLQNISLIFVGHLGNDELLLASASLATSFLTVVGFTLLVSIPSHFLLLIIFPSFAYHVFD